MIRPAGESVRPRKRVEAAGWVTVLAAECEARGGGPPPAAGGADRLASEGMTGASAMPAWARRSVEWTVRRRPTPRAAPTVQGPELATAIAFACSRAVTLWMNSLGLRDLRRACDPRTPPAAAVRERGARVDGSLRSAPALHRAHLHGRGAGFLGSDTRPGRGARDLGRCSGGAPLDPHRSDQLTTEHVPRIARSRSGSDLDDLAGAHPLAEDSHRDLADDRSTAERPVSR